MDSGTITFLGHDTKHFISNHTNHENLACISTIFFKENANCHLSSSSSKNKGITFEFNIFIKLKKYVRYSNLI